MVEKDVIPVLRKQQGFRDEITFVPADGKEAVAISLWEKKENADAYQTGAYPEVLKATKAGQVRHLEPPLSNTL